MQNLTTVLWNAGKHMFWYLRGTTKLEIWLNYGGDNIMNVYIDSDWGQERQERYSVSWYVFIMAVLPVSWHLKQLTVVAQSSKEAKFVALEMCVCEGL